MDDLLCNEENVPSSPKALLPLEVTTTTSIASVDPIEVVRLMTRREAEYESGCNPKYLEAIQRHGMEESWRYKICRWMFDTGKAFELTRDTVGTAVHFMDHYLSTKSVDKILLQLVSMVSMYIASKMHEHQPISMEEMELLSQRKFSRDDIRRVETHLLTTLGWRLSPPTPFMFARDFINVMDNVSATTKCELEQEVMEFLQDVTEDYGSLGFHRSSLGLAAVHVVWKARRLRPSVAIQDALRSVDATKEDFVACYRWLRELYRAKRQPQLVMQPRFVSVEESKMTDPSRSVSPTSVEDAAALCGGDPRGQLDDQLLVQEVVVQNKNKSSGNGNGNGDDAASPERERKRARHSVD